MAHVQLSDVGVTFRIYDAGQRSIKRRLLPFGSSKGTTGLDIEALSDIDLTLKPGSRVALLGANGSGKTTLMRVIAGLVPPKRGKVVIDGLPGAVFSTGFGVTPEASLAELACAQGLLVGLTSSEARNKVSDILDLAELAEQAQCPAHVAPPGILSRLGIAATLCLGADIILLDEVLDGMDPRLHHKFQAAILSRVEQGAILVVTERSRSLLSRFCSEALLLHDGRIVNRLPLAEMLPNAGAILTF